MSSRVDGSAPISEEKMLERKLEREKVRDSKLSKKGWEKIKSHGPGANGYPIELQDGTRYFLDLSEGFRGLLSIPMVYGWQQFRMYRITDEQFEALGLPPEEHKSNKASLLEADKKTVNNESVIIEEKLEEVQEKKDWSFGKSMLVLMITGPILMPVFNFILPAIATPIAFIVEPLGFFMPISLVLLGHVLMSSLAQSIVKQRLGKKWKKESSFELVNFKITNNLGPVFGSLFYVLFFGSIVFYAFSDRNTFEEGIATAIVVLISIIAGFIVSKVGAIATQNSKLYIRHAKAKQQ